MAKRIAGIKKTEVSAPRILWQQLEVLKAATQLALDSGDAESLIRIANSYNSISDTTRQIATHGSSGFENGHDLSSGPVKPVIGFGANCEDMGK